ncbi:DNA (cytosine-5)-methyltransferase 3B-like [Schistocerca nitens]|uniref:DNA (cytosine-5)-methyltransferase 3B-like n=1 Tax=Schistocerca nitens TaxID=7011 RepID=UPI002119627D|nr:DNA (cytosine-5)-methyltransferase 3B-like [Schistocerca nitens]
MQHAERSYRQSPQNCQELDFCLVWAKIDNEPWWPGIVIPGQVCRNTKSGYVWIFWNSERNVSQVEASQAIDFWENFVRFHDPSLLDEGYLEDNITNIKVFILMDLFHLQCHAWQKGYRIQSWSNDSVLSWARNGFPSLTRLAKETRELPQNIMEAVIDAGKGLYSVPTCRDYLAKSDPDEGKLVATNMPEKPPWSDFQRRNAERYKQGENICVACMRPPENSDEHPLFDAVICTECKERAKKYMFTTEENKLVACAICFWKSDVNCISNSCLWTFCTECCSTFTISRASRSCIRCLDQGSNLILGESENRLNKVLHMFSPSVIDTLCIPTQTIYCKKQLRVLSLFDGIGTGLFVLKEELLLPVTKYFASEIDHHAKKITDNNFPGQVTHLGDVRHITEDCISKILADGPIDLLIGGSPCNDLSLVNHLRKGLYDMQGSGHLFFHFQNILLKIRLLQRNHVLFYFYENVANLTKETKNAISVFLGHNPTIMDATHFSAQDRRRNFWGNIPGMHTTIQLKEDHKLQDYICGNPFASMQKLKTLTKSSEITVDAFGNFIIDGHGKPESLPTETLEKLFGFNAGYTNHEEVSTHMRRCLLSSAWSVAVVSRLFQGLKLFFHSGNNMQQEKNNC